MLEKIERPKIDIESVSPDNKFAKFIISPLERGFATTIGNSLRRVLLSSIPGTAVTSVKIAGIQHELSTVPGVKEDVTEIILNLKSLKVRLHCAGSKTVYINAKEEGIVRAKDIQADSEVEIIEPDMPIATLCEGAELNMEITVDRGKGYVSAEENKMFLPNNTDLNVIMVDSIYTPVLKVNAISSNTRVGQKTDYDKLILEVETDGTITPEEAVNLAANVLIEHYKIFTNLTQEVAFVTEIIADQNNEDMEKKLGLTIEELDLSVRSFNCLKRAGINVVADLVVKGEDEMMRVRNLGRKSFEEVVEKLNSLGLSLSNEN
ncbi:MAG: DNA-directed RNA polymerase subunit alpha [Ruminococcus sp.]|jgi:DNA-directed RNA polymerase subunit alpha|nr:DNA-directed RNA polymerase subunit alpha [Ruminococcus sp.]